MTADLQRLDEKPSFTFWTTLAHAFETQTKEAARSKWLFPHTGLFADLQHQTGYSKHSVLATLVYSGYSTTSLAVLRYIRIQCTPEIVKGQSFYQSHC